MMHRVPSLLAIWLLVAIVPVVMAAGVPPIQPACPVLRLQGNTRTTFPIQFGVDIVPPQKNDVAVHFKQDVPIYGLSLASSPDKPENDKFTVGSEPLSLHGKLLPNVTNPGIVAVRAETVGLRVPNGCRQPESTLVFDTGLANFAKIQIRDAGGMKCASSRCTLGDGSMPGQALPLDQPKRVVAVLVTNDGVSLKLPGPVAIVAKSSKGAELRGRELSVAPEMRAIDQVGPEQESAPFWITPGWHSTGSVTFQAKLDASDSEPVSLSADLSFSTLWPWWMLLLLCLAGGLFYAVAQTAVKAKGNLEVALAEVVKSRGSAFTMALLAAGAGYLAKAGELLDLKVKSNDELGYLILGTSFAAIGIEAILKNYKK